MKTLIIGAGNSGYAMAVHLKQDNHVVKIWNKNTENIKGLLKTRIINSKGKITGSFLIDEVTTNIKDALIDVDLILVTTPASAHKDIANLLSANMTESIPIVLNPGRTFGAIEFYNTFKKHSNLDVSVAETQTIIYTCRKLDDNNVDIISLKKDVLFATYKKDSKLEIYDVLPNVIKKYFTLEESILATSLGNVGMILHTAPTLLNSGWIENEKTKFNYYYDGISARIAEYIEEMDKERVKVAKHLETNVLSTTQWLKEKYNLSCNNIYDCLQENDAYRTIEAPKSLKHRYIFEDITCGLVPIESLAKLLDIETPFITAIIDLAILLLKYDFRKLGRSITINDLKFILGVDQET